MSQLAISGNIKNLRNITFWQFYYKMHGIYRSDAFNSMEKNSCASIANNVATKNVVFCKNKEEQGLKFYIKQAYSTVSKIFQGKEG